MDFDLQRNEVVVWHAPLDLGERKVDACHALLSEDEARRSASFVCPRDSSRFIVARAVLRCIAGGYLGRSPREIRFSYSPFGKPFLAFDQNPHSLAFNLSHSGGRMLVAFVREASVGVDIEEVRPIGDRDALVRSFFSPSEQKEFSRLSPELQPASFFRVWTRKEAFIKALGGGLSVPLESFDVSLTPGEPALLRAVRGTENRSHWHLADLDAGPGFTAAVAVSGTSPSRIRRRRWDPS